MNLNFQLGLKAYQGQNYYDASDHFKQAFREGHDRIESLYHIALCDFYIAACYMKGTGMVTGLPRRATLLEAKSTLEECLSCSEIEPQVRLLLCQIDFAIGLVSAGNNGYTKSFSDNCSRLRDLDRNLAAQLQSELPEITNAFS